MSIINKSMPFFSVVFDAESTLVVVKHGAHDFFWNTVHAEKFCVYLDLWSNLIFTYTIEK